MIIFTNEHKGLNRHYMQNENRFRTFHTNSKEEAEAIKKDVEARGFSVTKITTNLGTRIY